MRKPQELFTVRYAVLYDKWIKLDLPPEEQFTEVYSWCNYYVYVRRVDFYLFIKVQDISYNTIFEGTIANMYDYCKLKKKLKLKC